MIKCDPENDLTDSDLQILMYPLRFLSCGWPRVVQWRFSLPKTRPRISGIMRFWLTLGVFPKCWVPEVTHQNCWFLYLELHQVGIPNTKIVACISDATNLVGTLHLIVACISDAIPCISGRYTEFLQQTQAKCSPELTGGVTVYTIYIEATENGIFKAFLVTRHKSLVQWPMSLPWFVCSRLGPRWMMSVHSCAWLFFFYFACYGSSFARGLDVMFHGDCYNQTYITAKFSPHPPTPTLLV